MAPIEHDLFNSNTQPVAIFGSYITFTASLIYLILHHVLYYAHKSLPPSQAARLREGNRRKHVGIYIALSAISLGTSFYSLYVCLDLSYRVWAYERGEELPTTLWGPGGIFGKGDSTGLQLGRWMNDENPAMDGFEIAMEKSRRLWWALQWYLGASTWSSYVAMEGHRRNISYLWVFVTLSTLVSLTFAQNLFFLAVLWTPVPLQPAIGHSVAESPSSPSKGRKRSRSSQTVVTATKTSFTRFLQAPFATIGHWLPSKPAAWTPHPLLATLPPLISIVLTLLLSLATHTPTFATMLSLTFTSLYLPLLLPALAPLRLGRTSLSTAETHRAQITTFRTLGIISGLLYAVQTASALLDNDPGTHNHRYQAILHLKSARGPLERTRTGMGRVLGALGDHPAVRMVGWDVLLSGLGCGIWSGIRGLDARNMLTAVGWRGEAVAGTALAITQQPEAAKRNGAKREKGARRGSKREVEPDEDEDEESTAYPSGDAQGVFLADEENEEDWEAAALAWGLSALGGLGLGSASVFGAELVN